MGESCTSSLATGDVAVVVFATELLSQLRNGGIDLDRVSQVRARQDGKTPDKTNFEHQIFSTDHCRAHSGMASTSLYRPRLPARDRTTPKSVGRITSTIRRKMSVVSTPPRAGQQSSCSQSTPIRRALMGSGAPSPAPAFAYCRQALLITLLPSGSKISPSPIPSAMFSSLTLPNPTHGGQINLPMPWKPSKRLQ